MKPQQKTTTAAPKIPAVANAKELPLTDPRRKLSKAERKGLTKEQRKARIENVRASRGPAKNRFVKSFSRLAKTIEKQSGAFATTEIGEYLDEAVKRLRLAADEISELPTEWSPESGSAGTPKKFRFSVGETVAVVESKRKNYAGLLDDSELVSLEVLGQVGKHTRLLAQESGVKLVIESKHLVRAVTISQAAE